MCLVHNGSLSNHNNLRKWLKKQGQNSTPTTISAARYFAYRLGEGASLKEAWKPSHLSASSPSPWVQGRLRGAAYRPQARDTGGE
jgi:glutamate synthase domain-containing protein 1